MGGVGIANVMVISVLERRSEIGLRRALGATRGQVRLQFLSESLLLSLLGGVARRRPGGGGDGRLRHVPVVDGGRARWPPWAAAVGAALVIGAVAGLYPAMRAARLSPTEALRCGMKAAVSGPRRGARRGRRRHRPRRPSGRA